VPDHTAATRILRDDIVAQLRAAGRPMTTTELRKKAAKIPTRGAAEPLPPIQEQIYRVLCRLDRDGLVRRTTAGERTVTWTSTPSQADSEIADLEAALSLTGAPPVPPPEYPDILALTATHLEAAAATARHAAAHGIPVTTAFSDAVTRCADVLIAIVRTDCQPEHPRWFHDAPECEPIPPAAPLNPHRNDTP
jgi:hypothetical protein